MNENISKYPASLSLSTEPIITHENIANINILSSFLECAGEEKVI